MPQNRYYYYDHDRCAFVEVQPKRNRLYVQAAVVVVLALVLAGGVMWGVDEVTHTPQELALKAENEALQQQLEHVGERMEHFSAELEELSASDQQLYRTLFQAEPIPEDVRQVGVGGTDPYEQFSRFSAGTASLLRETSSTLDQLEREIGLQNVSFRELSKMAEDRETQWAQMPVLRPATGPVVSAYGMRRHPILRVRRMHAGIDVLVRTGSKVVAAGDGIVRKARYSPTLGHHVEIEHPAVGFTTVYGHLSEIPREIRPGRSVERGQVIGLSGNTGLSTGPHLHYEVHETGGRSLNPIDFLMPGMTPAQYNELVAKLERTDTSLD